MSVLIFKRNHRMTLRTRKPVPQELTTFKKSREEYNLPICGDILRRVLASDPNIMIDENTICEITERLVGGFDPDKIIL